jgi:hypothetical protein
MRLVVLWVALALAVFGVVAVLIGLSLVSQVNWQETGSIDGPVNQTVPTSGAVTEDVFGGPGPVDFTERAIAVWSAPYGGANSLRFEVLSLPLGSNGGILESAGLANTTMVAFGPTSPIDFVDVTYSVKFAGPYEMTYALVNQSPQPVKVTSVAVVLEAPYSPNAQTGWWMEILGTVSIALSAFLVAVVSVRSRSRRRNQPTLESEARDLSSSRILALGLSSWAKVTIPTNENTRSRRINRMRVGEIVVYEEVHS